MEHQDRKAYSKVGPIGCIDALASMLSISAKDLLTVSKSVESFWIPGKTLRKKSGEPRLTSNAKEPLKGLHEKIKNRLLKRVCYPYYLLGGISDSMMPRDYKCHAAIHSGKNILISEDIKDFFSSTKTDVVHSIWQCLFHTSPDVASVLTSLTTYNDCLPQGWKTSGYLANLAFWDLEPDLVERLEKRGFSYSRFIDDITVSSRCRIGASKKSFVISEIYRMLSLRGYSPKRAKHRIATNDNRMGVTGLNVNKNTSSMPKEKRKIIRAMVHRCENHYMQDRTSEGYRKSWERTSGKVSTLTRFHETEGNKLRKRLQTVKPIR
ncbi:reverse transcriptase family protein [Candidatus Thiosymbion oneisti]|uniref:reverse transcriptase family protein n=1 Tax=Candidatus Thiosymbion oneisti TaxID=589554 RepID=UPI0010611DED|nr:reverse transcriptase family protein [Candidatus Thiosymbion oneisti]